MNNDDRGRWRLLASSSPTGFSGDSTLEKCPTCGLWQQVGPKEQSDGEVEGREPDTDRVDRGGEERDSVRDQASARDVERELARARFAQHRAKWAQEKAMAQAARRAQPRRRKGRR